MTSCFTVSVHLAAHVLLFLHRARNVAVTTASSGGGGLRGGSRESLLTGADGKQRNGNKASCHYTLATRLAQHGDGGGDDYTQTSN